VLLGDGVGVGVNGSSGFNIELGIIVVSVMKEIGGSKEVANVELEVIVGVGS
jgi:hypothetical protein